MEGNNEINKGEVVSPTSESKVVSPSQGLNEGLRGLVDRLKKTEEELNEAEEKAGITSKPEEDNENEKEIPRPMSYINPNKKDV